jgi:hypothetical protein
MLLKESELVEIEEEKQLRVIELQLTPPAIPYPLQFPVDRKERVKKPASA